MRSVLKLLCVGLAFPVSAWAQNGAAGRAPAPDTAALELYGFLFAQLAAESRETGRDRFLNIQPVPSPDGVAREPDAFFDISATRVGLKYRVGNADRRDLFANLEIDFDTPDGGPRIRHAYGEIALGPWRFLAGQTWAIVSQLDPVTVNSDNLFNLGNTYERVPQFRVSYERHLGAGKLEFQAGAVTFFGAFDQRDLAVQPAGAMELETGTPAVFQGRLRFGWQAAGRPSHVAVAASAGRVSAEALSGAEGHATHFLLVGETLLPLGVGLELAAEAFYGQAAGFNGGVGQTAVVTADGALEPVKTRGGFLQARLLPQAGLELHLVAGFDDPGERPRGTPLTIGGNWTVLANAFWRLARSWTSALEVQYVRTDYEAQALTADNLRSTLAVFVNF